MDYDITFCSKKDCKNLKCKRNQKSLPDLEKNYLFWISDFKECENWEDKKC